MALAQVNFFSEAIGLSTSMYVILPQATKSQIGMTGVATRKEHPVLYLLHGMSDDHTIWLRRTSIERYVASMGLAVVMPEVHRSFYTDMEAGYKYWTFVSEELPELVRSFFPISARREDNFVAGLSMGGYGAFKLALSHPDRFAAAASLSGATGIGHSKREPSPDMKLIYGGRPVAGTPNDLYYLAEQTAKNAARKPALYQCCGTGDFLYEDNVAFRDYVRTLDLDLAYEEDPGDVHEWGYWDRKIQTVLKWLPLQQGQ